MKKKLLLITTTSLMAISLTSCQIISDIINSAQGQQSTLPYGSQAVASSAEPIVDISTPPADDIEAKPASKTYHNYIENNVYPLSATPTKGEAKLLVIPVWFNDSNKFIKEANKDNVRQDIHDAYFGDIDSVGWESVESYYETESLGTLELTGTVSAWYEPDKSYTYYSTDPYDEDTGEGCPKTMALAESATKWYFDNHTSEKRSDYDCDNDGYLDGVMLIYAAPDYATLNNQRYDNLWAYCYWVQDYSAQNPNNPGVNAFFWASYDFMYGKEVASSRSGNRYYSGDTSHCKIDAHTFIHEMGHMFGLEDYYDYSSYAYAPAGGFSMQDHNVGGHDPFSVFALGWGKAYVPAASAEINLRPFVTSGEMVILSPNWNSFNSPFDEYLILEYYTNEGLNYYDAAHPYMDGLKEYPTGSQESGIRLWHVDSRLLYRSEDASYSASQVTADPMLGGSYYVTLMMTNSYDDGGSDSSERISPLGSAYADYNQLQWIRNNKNTSHRSKTTLTNNYLFHKDDVFTMEDYKKQFVNEGKLNSDSDLGFSFEVKELGEEYATIAINKL